MLRMDQVHVIRHKVLREGVSIRQVARELGLSRNTVSKYLGQSAPVRRTYRRRVRPVLEQIRERLEELLTEWEPRTTAKQRLTGVRMLRALHEEGYQVGRTVIYEYLRERRRQRAEVYIPLIHRAGDEAQVDFFEVTVEIDGVWVKVWKFLLRLMYSGREFVWLYQRCDKLAFFDGHVRAFAYLGGVPRRCVYDNLSAAVQKIMGAERQLNKRFEALVSHYLYEPCFARVGEGHDKGGVESRGKAIRLQHLAPVPRGESLNAIAQALLTGLGQAFAEQRNMEGRRLIELWEEERPQLLALPAASFEVSEPAIVDISSRALVRIEGAWYSTPFPVGATARDRLHRGGANPPGLHGRECYPSARWLRPTPGGLSPLFVRTRAQTTGGPPGCTRVAGRTGRALESFMAIARRYPWST